MAKVISLRAVRRQKARDIAREIGSQSAAKSGRTNHEITLQSRVGKALDQHLDRHKREPS